MKLAPFIASRIFSLSGKYISSAVIRIAILSVALGLAVMIISVAIVIGFKNQIRDKVIGFAAPIKIEVLDNNDSYEKQALILDQVLMDKIRELDGVIHFQGVIEKPALIRTENQVQGIVLKGIGTDYDSTYFSSKIIEGKMPDIQEDSICNQVLISKKTADLLDLKTHDAIRFWFLSHDQQQPRGRKLIVSGIYETGLLEFDKRYAFADVKHLQKLNGWQKDQFSTIEVQLKKNTSAWEINDSLYFVLPAELVSSTAQESYPQIFDWLNLQDMNVVIIIVLMVLVSGITIVGTLLILILERTSMIGLLKAFGATNGLIRRIFQSLSFFILIRGLIIGNFIGIGFCLLQSYFGIFKLPAESYYLSEVPVDISLFQILIINAGTLIIWSVILYIPVSVINAIHPSKSIRFE
jgi:lipoprotein-releasing system permease protein